MKQAQSYRSRPTSRAFRPSPAVGSRERGRVENERGGSPVLDAVEWAFQALWWVVTFPFRLVFGIVSLLGRMTGVTVGFSLMVVGMALGAGPLYLIGAPIFLIGLLLTLRCLG